MTHPNSLAHQDNPRLHKVEITQFSSESDSVDEILSDNGAEEAVSAILRQIEAASEDIGAVLEKNLSLPTQYLTMKKTFNVLHWYIVTDVAALVFGFLAAWLMSAIINVTFFDRANLIVPTVTYMVLALQYAALSAGVMLWFVHARHYEMRTPFWMETRKIVEAAGFAMLINCFLQVVSKLDFSRLWLITAWVFSMIGIITFRAIARNVLRRFNVWSIPTVLIGNGATAAETRAVLGSETNLGYRLVAQIRDLPLAFKEANFSWVALCRSYKVENVVVALDGEDFVHACPALAQLMRERVPFSVVPPTHNLSVVGMTPQFFLGQDVMLMTHNKGLDHLLSRFLKRSFDIMISASAIVITSPIIFLLACIVKMDGGPAFYRHKRLGLNGQVFWCLKLRSMMVKNYEVLMKYLADNPAARAEWLRDHKLRHDPRVSLVGAFMRKTSLDELPQLWNVLRGEMSIVGPRPIIVSETLKYNSDIAFYFRVRPGITGLWQVSGRNDVTYDERVRMDSWYVRNWSLWHDITIMCKTFGVVFKRQGAY